MPSTSAGQAGQDVAAAPQLLKLCTLLATDCPRRCACLLLFEAPCAQAARCVLSCAAPQLLKLCTLLTTDCPGGAPARCCRAFQ